MLNSFQLTWSAFLLGLGSIAVVWLIFIYILYQFKKKSTAKAKIIIGGIRLVNLLFLYIFLQFLLTHLLLPETWEGYGSVSLQVLMILGVARICINILKNSIDLATKPYGNEKQASSILKNLLTIVIWAFGITLVLNSAGISVTPLLTALGVGGIAVALAVQTPLANLFAGLQILLSRQIRLGDYIRLASGEEGTIQDISWRTMILRTRGDVSIIIPNSTVASSIITNDSWPQKPYFAVISVQVGYESDLEKVRQIALEIAREVSLGVSNSENLAAQATARFTTFTDSGINLNISVTAKNHGEVALLTDGIILKIHRRFQEENISIPYPIRQIIQ